MDYDLLSSNKSGGGFDVSEWVDNTFGTHWKLWFGILVLICIILIFVIVYQNKKQSFSPASTYRNQVLSGSIYGGGGAFGAETAVSGPAPGATVVSTTSVQNSDGSVTQTVHMSDGSSQTYTTSNAAGSSYAQQYGGTGSGITIPPDSWYNSDGSLSPDAVNYCVGSGDPQSINDNLYLQAIAAEGPASIGANGSSGSENMTSDNMLMAANRGY